MAAGSAPDEFGFAEAPDPRVHRRRVLIARLIVVATFLVVWQASVATGLVDAFWISSPVLVVDEIWRQLASGDLIDDVAITVFEALIAFVVSSALGIVAGLLLARSPFWDEVLAPLVLALNSLPRVALAPLIILWFGIGITAKVVTAFTLVFFILLVNTLGGAKNVDNDILTIAKLMGASKHDILWKVTLPSALPWIFAGLNLGLTYSLLDPGVQSGPRLRYREQRRHLQYSRGIRRPHHFGSGCMAVQHPDAQDRGEAAAMETLHDERLSKRYVADHSQDPTG
jgi:NitT/TauT family transport system permease protein